MGKRGRRQPVIPLTTGNDPSLWKYESVSEALQVNIDILAALVQSSALPMEETPGVDQVGASVRLSVDQIAQEKHDDQTDVYGHVALQTR